MKRLPQLKILSVLGLASVLASVALFAGCGGGHSINQGSVSGKITYKGAPVTGGTITFFPTSGTGSAPVTIKPDGTYSSTDVPMGDMGVSIETESVKGLGGGGPAYNIPKGMKPPSGTPQPEQPKIQGGANMPVYVQIPQKYVNPKTSGLTCTIKPGKNVCDFDLK
jgi:hypothetical protein